MIGLQDQIQFTEALDLIMSKIIGVLSSYNPEILWYLGDALRVGLSVDEIFDLTLNNGIDQPDLLESQINNIPGVLENGLFINLTDEVLVGKVVNEAVGVDCLKKI